MALIHRRKLLAKELLTIDREIDHVRLAIEAELRAADSTTVLKISYWRQRLLNLLSKGSVLPSQRDAILALLKRIEPFEDC